MKKFSIVLLAILLFWGCENDDFLYQGEEGGVSGLYFLKVTSTSIDGTPQGYTDSSSYSFQNDAWDVETHRVKIPVQLFGMLSDEDRPFRLKVVGGTAVEGEDFLPLPEKYIFPADKANTEAWVDIRRTPKLTKEHRYLVVELLENEHFKLLMPEIQDLSKRDTLKTNIFKISFTEQITEMLYYEYFGESYFGKWSVKKFHMINAISGWTLKQWQDAIWGDQPVTLGKMPYIATLLRRQLQEFADKGEPVMDEENAEYMQLGNSYKVDYSRYEID